MHLPEIKKLSKPSPPSLEGLTQWALQQELADHRAVTVTSYKAWPGAGMVCSECGREGLVLWENKISILPSWVSTVSTSLQGILCLSALLELCCCVKLICSDDRTVL